MRASTPTRRGGPSPFDMGLDAELLRPAADRHGGSRLNRRGPPPIMAPTQGPARAAWTRFFWNPRLGVTRPSIDRVLVKRSGETIP